MVNPPSFSVSKELKASPALLTNPNTGTASLAVKLKPSEGIAICSRSAFAKATVSVNSFVTSAGDPSANKDVSPRAAALFIASKDCCCMSAFFFCSAARRAPSGVYASPLAASSFALINKSSLFAE